MDAKTDCTPHCPARLVAEEAFNAHPANTKKFIIELQRLDKNYRLKEDLDQSAIDRMINEQNKIAAKYGFPSVERLHELCLCGFFKE